MENPSSKATIQVLDRASRILRVLTQHHEPVNLKTIAEEAGLHVSTCHRIVNDLVHLRLVEKGSSAGSYKLGLRLLQLGNLVRERLSVRETAHPGLVELHKLTNQAVSLGIRQNDSVVFIDIVTNEEPNVQIVRLTGGTAPLHTTGAGKLFLSEDSFEQVRAYALRTNLEKRTQKTINDLDALLSELTKVRTLGFAEDHDELETGVHSIAAGIRDDSGKMVASISISTVDQIQENWISEIKQVADNISEHLGWVTSTDGFYFRPGFQ